MFNFFKKAENKDFNIAEVSNNNVNDYLRNGQLQLIYLISPDFGGSEGRENQIVVTPQAAKEKDIIDDELYNFLSQGRSVKNFHVDLKYKGESIVPSEIIITAIIDGNDYNKVITVW